MNLCVDCMFFAKSPFAGRDRCLHPANLFPDLVRGGHKTMDPSWLRRQPSRSDVCGWDGRWFEPKLKETEPKSWRLKENDGEPSLTESPNA